MMHKNGRYVYVWDRGVISRDEKGNAVRVVGSTQDVSQRIQNKLALEQANQRLPNVACSTRSDCPLKSESVKLMEGSS